MAAQQCLLGGRAAALAHRDGVVAGQDLAGIALVDDPAMGGDRGGLVANLDLGRRLGDGDRFADVTLGNGIAIGVDRDIAVQIDDAFEQLIDRRQYVGQRNEVRLLDDVGGLG